MRNHVNNYFKTYRNIPFLVIAGGIATFVLLIFLFSSCDIRSDHPGYSYLPDMENSRAYETYSSNPNFSDSMTMRKPVDGTIPRGFIPYPYEKNDDDLALAGKKLTNPLEHTSENLERGKIVYERFCMTCHGATGDGKGHLYTSGKYTYPPGNLITEKVVNRSDGEIYHIITVGYNIMGAHGSLIRPEDRWKVVMYIRDELQQKSNTKNQTALNN